MVINGRLVKADCRTTTVSRPALVLAAWREARSGREGGHGCSMSTGNALIGGCPTNGVEFDPEAPATYLRLGDDTVTHTVGVVDAFPELDVRAVRIALSGHGIAPA